MQASATRRSITPGASTGSAVMALFADAFERDTAAVSLPRPEFQLTVRFGPSSRDGVDVHALGARQQVHRKLILNGQRAVTARFRLGAHEAVLGVPAPEIAGHVVALEDLWGAPAARRLCERLAGAHDIVEEAAILEGAISERLTRVKRRNPRAQLAVAAAERLSRASVKAVADDLGVSERHLRRVFHENIGMCPKAFTKLARFRSALREARRDDRVNWASVAAATGYYDQAHLIAEFRAIAGVTPRALLRELREESRPLSS